MAIGLSWEPFELHSILFEGRKENARHSEPFCLIDKIDSFELLGRHWDRANALDIWMTKRTPNFAHVLKNHIGL
jgi:hypothetical protein